jgi:hypothetical protein
MGGSWSTRKWRGRRRRRRSEGGLLLLAPALPNGVTEVSGEMVFGRKRRWRIDVACKTIRLCLRSSLGASLVMVADLALTLSLLLLPLK